MIGKLKGVVDSLHEDHVILDVHGVGYVVACSTRTLQKLPRAGEAAVLAIETQVREDAIRLFGFLSDSERDWFRLLQNVQGVGSKVALAILSILPPAELSAAIALQDKVAVSRAPGVGPKLAARIVAELKDKAGAFSTVDPAAARLAGDDFSPGGSRRRRRRFRRWSISATPGRRRRPPSPRASRRWARRQRPPR